jgi:hypothetical protein
MDTMATAHPLLGAALTQVAEQITECNEIAAKINSYGNTRAELKAIRDDNPTDDPILTEYRETREKLLAALAESEKNADAHVFAKGLISVEPIDVDALTDSAKELTGQIKASLKALALFGATDDDLKTLPEQDGIKGERKVSVSATGTKRPRVTLLQYSVDNGETYAESFKDVAQEDGSNKRTVNFTNLAADLSKALKVKVDGSEIRDAAFSAHGGDDLSTLNGDVLEFAFSVTANDAEKSVKNVMIRVTAGG